jgi:hypothetical protein
MIMPHLEMDEAAKGQNMEGGCQRDGYVFNKMDTFVGNLHLQGVLGRATNKIRQY